MAIADSQMWHSCTQILKDTPKTIEPSKSANGLQVHNDTVGRVYVVLNWASGDTEVSATNFDMALAATGSVYTYRRQMSVDPRITSLRVIGSATGYLGVVGW